MSRDDGQSTAEVVGKRANNPGPGERPLTLAEREKIEEGTQMIP